MKLRNVLLTLGLATTVAAGAGATMLASVNNQPIESSASTVDATYGKIYVDIKWASNWTDDGARLRARFFGEGKDAVWYNWELVSGTVYEIEYNPDGYTGFNLYRLDPNGVDNSVDSKWNQTVDITLTQGFNYWAMWDSGSLSYGNYQGAWQTDRYFNGSLSPTPDTMRYFFCFTNNIWSEAFLEGCELGMHAYSDTLKTDYFYGMIQYENGSAAGYSHKFFYVDVPTGVEKLQFIALPGYTTGTKTNWSIKYWHTVTLSISSYPCSKLWIATLGGTNDGNNSSWTLSINANETLETKWTTSAYAMSKVLETYYTCSSSTVNGYGAYTNLKNNFWDCKDYSNGSFDNVWFTDYSRSDYKNAHDSYDGTSRDGDYWITVQAKWDALEAMNNDPTSLRIFVSPILNNENSCLIVITACAVVILATSAFFILRGVKKES